MTTTPVPTWAIDLAMELEKVYPQIDVERARYVRNKLLKFDERVARQAVTEYIERSGDEFLNLGKLLAVAHRVNLQLNEGPNSVNQQSARRQADIAQRARYAEMWDKAEQFVIDLPESKQRQYRETFLAAQPSTLRKMYTGIFEKAKLPKNFVSYVYESETGRKVEAITPPPGIAPAITAQRDPFEKDDEVPAWI